MVLPVDDGQADAAAELARRAADAGLRAEVDAAGSLGARIRDAARRRVPYLGVLGAREAADGRLRCACAAAVPWTRCPPKPRSP